MVITPLVAIHQQHIQNAAFYNIPASEFGSPNFNPFHHRLFFCPAHKVADSSFFKQLETLKNAKLLNRIVIDEAHHLVTSKDFRNCFSLMANLLGFEAPLVFLSATLPPITVTELLRVMRLDSPAVDVIRAPTYRKNIAYEIIKVEPQQLQSQVVLHALAEEAGFSLVDRGLIFCQSVDVAREVASSLHCQFYVGPMDPSEKPLVASTWQAGKDRWLVATSAFAEGVDYPHVRAVIVMEAPRGLCEYDQMTGRVGRDGLPAKAKLIYSQLRPVQDSSESDHLGRIPMHRLLTLTNQCERVERGLFFDNQAHTCQSLPGASHCARCLASNVSFFPFHPCHHFLSPSPQNSPAPSRAPSLTQSASNSFRMPIPNASLPSSSPVTHASTPSPFTNLPPHGLVHIQRANAVIPPQNGVDQFCTQSFPPALPAPVAAPVPPTMRPRIQASASVSASASASSSSPRILVPNSSSPIPAPSPPSPSGYVFEDYNLKAAALKRLLESTVRVCPICWFQGETEFHYYFYCERYKPIKAQYDSLFKKVKLPPLTMCYFCLVPQAAPFNHPTPSQGRIDPSQCTYPDFLKPLAFLITTTESTRNEIFDQIRAPPQHRTVAYLLQLYRTPVNLPSLPHILEIIVIYLFLHRRNGC